MKKIAEMSAEDTYSEETLDEVFSDEDEIHRARVLLTLEEHAKDKGKVIQFREMVKAYKRSKRQIERMERERNRKPVPLENMTEFTGKYPPMRCGSWVAQDGGVWAQDKGNLDVQACYHPILPIERLKNLETGEEQIRIAYKRNGRWDEFVVPKTIVTSASKIVALSGRGVAVTSENAKMLVRYLADVENLNEDNIGVQFSSSKLGWIKNDFLPYDTDIIFDGDTRFKQLFESIREEGARKVWFDHVKQIRAAGRLESRFMLAASFASILIPIVGGLPFIIDLWGETEGGKTVTLMLAASVWANPAESAYIGDFKTTDVALEARADLLNNLPIILDDTSKTSARIRENFEGVVYDLCSGKGKSRSNKELGMNRENRWKNAILTNGERPMTSYVTQGGAINRILEVECGNNIFDNPHETAEILKKNFGFAGKEFVQIVKDMGEDAIRQMHKGFLDQMQDDEKMQKQALAISIILTADKIATDALFEDGQYISIDAAKSVLIDRNELSDNERAYQFVLSEIDVNQAKFGTKDKDADTIEHWGKIENGWATIYNNVFDGMMKRGGFSRKGFLNWAKRQNLLQVTAKDLTQVRKIDGRPTRCVVLRIDGEPEQGELVTGTDGFIQIPGDIQEELPFD